jgi:hypothetical protein
MRKYEKTNNCQQITTHKTKDWETLFSLKMVLLATKDNITNLIICERLNIFFP